MTKQERDKEYEKVMEDWWKYRTITEQKNYARKKIAEECSLAIESLINDELEGYDVSPSTLEILYDDIIKVIKGEE